MDYPVWQLANLGGGLLIAVIATVHVMVAHFAVGGGFYLVLTEHYVRSRNLPGGLAHVKKHARFFLLLTMVFGGLTGVGIWFIMALLAPAATSYLIHAFVFFWAAEWVCFVVEIAALLVYYYRFDSMRAREHLTVGWIYAAAAWLSLFLIGGIVSFMLTPGLYPATGNIWDAFFNPSLWPSVFLRTAISLLLAGVFGFITALSVPEEKTRERLLRFCAIWAVAPFFAVLASGVWYLNSLPGAVKALVGGGNPEIAPYLKAFVYSGPVLAVLAALMAVKSLGRTRTVLCVALLVLGYVYIGSFEYVREAARRPWLIPGIIYSNGQAPAGREGAPDKGLLAATGWAFNKDITKENRLAAGRELFNLACLACHSLGGPMNDIRRLTAKYPLFGATAMLTGMGKTSPYMPPFAGGVKEKDALAVYLTQGLHGEKPKAAPPAIVPLPEVSLPYQADREYTLLAYAAQGMHFFSDAGQALSILPPGNTLRAVLIKRGDPPVMIGSEAEITYALAPADADPAARLNFWQYAASLTGQEIKAGQGLSGLGTSGTLAAAPGDTVFSARGVPVSPYPAGGGFNPYPLAQIEAKLGGKSVAKTQAVLPASTEMGCLNCHGGPWREDARAGISPATAADILSGHDRRNGTRLKAMAASGAPKSCQACHGDPAIGAAGDGARLSLSAAVHGFHAPVLAGMGDKACVSCHPAAPDGATRAFRGAHAAMGFSCTDCHGVLEDNAAALLKYEQGQGKARASVLLSRFATRAMLLDKINPRAPWVNLPDCLTCHASYGRGGSGADTAFNVWTKDAAGLFAARKDEMGAVPCAACHGAPHAEYPALNPYAKNRDVIQPLQYQNRAGVIGGKGGCIACHTSPMDISAHHELPD